MNVKMSVASDKMSVVTGGMPAMAAKTPAAKSDAIFGGRKPDREKLAGSKFSWLKSRSIILAAELPA